MFFNADSQVQKNKKTKQRKPKYKKTKKQKTKNKKKTLFIQNAIKKWKEYSFEQIQINVYIET